ncbi:MAG: hypothetical protein QOK23_205 [Gammaproteobacteria bacterium]|jgi:uncharacterized ion transporter superfamily protein YfcC|nr:hypothetical protein [Gammaproteobacteria bacterium]
MMTAHSSKLRRQGRLHPVLTMLAMVFAAAVLTHVVPAGKFDRDGKQVVPGSYHSSPKLNGLPALLSMTAPAETDSPARAAGLVALFASIPAGMTKSATLIFMVMFVGGMFGVLRATGAVDAGVNSLLQLCSGNVNLLAAGLMLLLAAGSTFLGFLSQYLAIIPLVMALGQRLGLPNLFVPAVVVMASMIGYAASVTNPILLSVAQPLAGVPIFSGFVPRFGIFVVMFALGLGYVLLYLRRLPKVDHIPEAAALTARQLAVLVSVALGGTVLVIGTSLWSWGTAEHGSFFIAFALSLALVGGLGLGAAADAFLEGMRGMLLACVMIGLGSAMQIILQSSQVLDSIVQGFASLIQDHKGSVVAGGMMGAEMVFDLLIHSTSALATITMPILTPIGQLAGVSGQVTVTALLLGSGLTNMVSPTNGLLLAFLAASKVDYIEWFRFMAPLFAVFCLIGLAALYLMMAFSA